MATYAAEQLVNLDGAESSLFDALDSSCRRAVRKAEKSRATFRTGVGDAALQDYADLAEVSASRTGQALPPLDFYAAIMSGLRAGGRTHCFFVDVDGELAAGLIVLAYKNALSFLANASHPDFLHARVNDYIHWQTIRWAHANGYEIYRLGPYFPTVPKGWPIEQVSRFKKKFSNMEVEQVQGSFFRKRAQYRLIGKQLLDLLCCEKGMSSL
jgi:lipid II:glycine glycyltransferase (peptidoglycan interpeptide bridge formation enzyme)